MLLLNCCSNSSNLYSANTKQKVDFSHYSKAIIYDLEDDYSRSKKRQKILSKGKLFSDLLANILEAEEIFLEVERNSKTEQQALLIRGKITNLQEGSRVARNFIGIGKAAAAFAAKIEFIDNQSQKVIAIISINEKTSPLGGVFASLEDLDSIIEASAEITVDELLKTYKTK